MIKKEELFKISKLNKEIRKKKNRLDLLRDKAQSPPEMKNADKVQSSKKGDPMTDIVALVCDLEREVKADEKELGKLKTKAGGLYAIIGGINREIMILRYNEGEDWEEIGKMVGYSGRHVRRIHNEIIRTIFN